MALFWLSDEAWAAIEPYWFGAGRLLTKALALTDVINRLRVLMLTAGNFGDVKAVAALFECTGRMRDLLGDNTMISTSCPAWFAMPVPSRWFRVEAIAKTLIGKLSSDRKLQTRTLDTQVPRALLSLARVHIGSHAGHHS
jgi:hypothetical protein